jgi:uncharacterized membrane protein
MAKQLSHNSVRLLLALSFSSLVSFGFFIGRFLATGSTDYWFLVWNLALAWIPVGLSLWLLARLRRHRWLTPANIILSFLWLGFLPNTFYIASDIIHLQDSGQIGMLYDLVMLLSFTFSGFILGYLSLFKIHQRLKKTLSPLYSGLVVAIVLALCSFAIYLGRYLRWNSWDVLINPAGVIFDVSEPFISPSSHPQVFTTSLMFFVLLGSIYAVAYQLIKIARSSSSDL